MTTNPLPFAAIRRLLTPAPSYRARLNRAIHAPSRLTFASWDIAATMARRAMAVRCEVYADNHGTCGARASF